MTGQVAATSEQFEFRHLYQTLNNDEGNYGPSGSVASAADVGLRTSLRHANAVCRLPETFVSLVNENEAPYPEAIRYLSVVR